MNYYVDEGVREVEEPQRCALSSHRKQSRPESTQTSACDTPHLATCVGYIALSRSELNTYLA